MKFSYIWDNRMIELGLTGNDLLVFSIIHSYSQDNSSGYYGGVKYLTAAIGINKVTAYRILSRLENQKLIRVENGKYFTELRNATDDEKDFAKRNLNLQNATNLNKTKRKEAKEKENKDNIKYKECLARARTQEENTHSIYSNDLFSKDLKDVILEFLSNLKDPINDHQFNAIINLIKNAVDYVGSDGTIGWINQHIVENRQSLYPDRLASFLKKSQPGAKKVKNEPDWLQSYIDNF